LAGGETVAALVYKICTAADWREAEQAGAFHGAGVDLKDGYMHLSASGQVVETAERHFAGQHDLVLVAVDIAALGAALKWEAARDGALFPHLNGPLRLDAVVWTKSLRLGPDGRHVFPELDS
jgi:uncharacterized protein (DUF952 family)